MSKSPGQFFTLRDLLAKGFTGPRSPLSAPDSAHYRETFNFTLEGLHGAQPPWRGLMNAWPNCANWPAAPPPRRMAVLVAAFSTALDDDLNISARLGRRLRMGARNQPHLGRQSMDPAAGRLRPGRVGQDRFRPGHRRAAEPEAPAELQALLEARQAARKAKDFKRSDAIRDELKAKGWIIEDTPKGQRLKKL